MTVFSTTPAVPDEFLPTHVALVMDGNGRWAQERGLPRTEGHKRGEAVLLSIVDACLELGIPYLSAYAFSTENWRRSVGEVRFLMGFNRDEELTKDNTAMTLAMCVNYGGRAEIVDAARSIAALAAEGKLRPEDINEKNFADFLDEPDMPDVDLFLRPSGEKRTSNFLLWQSAYAEMVYQDKLFPDFTPDDLYAAVLEYARRDRRFGGVK